MEDTIKIGNSTIIISDECCVSSQKEIDSIIERYSEIVMESRLKQLKQREKEKQQATAIS